MILYNQLNYTVYSMSLLLVCSSFLQWSDFSEGGTSLAEVANHTDISYVNSLASYVDG